MAAKGMGKEHKMTKWARAIGKGVRQGHGARARCNNGYFSVYVYILGEFFLAPLAKGGGGAWPPCSGAPGCKWSKISLS